MDKREGQVGQKKKVGWIKEKVRMDRRKDGMNKGEGQDGYKKRMVWIRRQGWDG